MCVCYMCVCVCVCVPHVADDDCNLENLTAATAASVSTAGQDANCEQMKVAKMFREAFSSLFSFSFYYSFSYSFLFLLLLLLLLQVLYMCICPKILAISLTVPSIRFVSLSRCLSVFLSVCLSVWSLFVFASASFFRQFNWRSKELQCICSFSENADASTIHNPYPESLYPILHQPPPPPWGGSVGHCAPCVGGTLAGWLFGWLTAFNRRADATGKKHQQIKYAS